MSKKRIGVIAPFQNGDLMEASAVLYYREELWPNSDIVWFCNEPHSDCLKYHDIEIRPFPHGWEHPHLCLENAGWEDWSKTKTEDNRLNELKNNFESLKDLDEGFFPLPWQISVEKRAGIPYTECSRKVFGVNPLWRWHPYLLFSDEERERVKDFMEALPKKRNILIESYGGSGQTLLSESMVKNTLLMCKLAWGECNFLFASHKFLRNQEEYPEWLKNEEGFISMTEFPVRLFGLINDYCELMICVSSGISVATSCWDAKPVTKLQFCGSEICSTVSIANGKIVSVYTGDKPNITKGESEYYNQLTLLLNELT